jgi:hypothetical protein
MTRVLVVEDDPQLVRALVINLRARKSIMLEAWEPVVTPARWLGHSFPAVTLGYYAHFTPEEGSKGRPAIVGLLGRRGDGHASRHSPHSPQG